MPYVIAGTIIGMGVGTLADGLSLGWAKRTVPQREAVAPQPGIQLLAAPMPRGALLGVSGTF